MNHPASLTVFFDPTFDIVAVGDPGRTRTVLASILFLVAIGIGLVVLAAWLIRSTRVDPEVLAPLEVMSERTWRRADPVWQRRRLDEVRPDGAEPLDPTVPPPSTDAEFDRGPRSTGFDDFDDLLRRFGVDIESAAATEPAPADHAPPAEPPIDEESEPSSPPVATDADEAAASDLVPADGAPDDELDVVPTDGAAAPIAADSVADDAPEVEPAAARDEDDTNVDTSDDGSNEGADVDERTVDEGTVDDETIDGTVGEHEPVEAQERR